MSGGGLARLWRAAGHEVTEIGREGGEASSADVIVVAVPSDSITDALGKVSGIAGKIAIDTTNAHAGRDETHESLAHEVKASIGGPVSKSFNLQYAALYDQVSSQRVMPSNLYAAEEGAKELTERLILDAGYDPVSVGDIEQARALEDCGMNLFRAIRLSGLGPNFQRFARPGEL